MDVFSWLLIGHLVGDWLLQNRWMAEGKLHGPLSGALHVHCLIYAGVVSLVMWFSQGAMGMILIISGVILFASHCAIDGFHLATWWGQGMRQSETALVRVGVDQTLHLIVLAGLTLVVGP